MCLNRVGEGDREPAPHLAVLDPLVAGRDIEAGVAKDEGRRHVCPERGRTEVEEVEVVPPQKATRACEILTGSGALADDATVGRLDPHAAVLKDAPLAAARIGREYNALLIGSDARLKVAEPGSL